MADALKYSMLTGGIFNRRISMQAMSESELRDVLDILRAAKGHGTSMVGHVE